MDGQRTANVRTHVLTEETAALLGKKRAKGTITPTRP